MPHWVYDTIYERIIEFSDHCYIERSRTLLQRRLRAGSFLKELLEQMKLIESHKKFKSVRIYSASDLPVADVLSALGAFNNKAPPFGSTVMFEFYTNIFYRKNFVRLYYLNDTYSERPHMLTIKNCIDDEICSFRKVRLQIEKYIPMDTRFECGLK
ncbi:lysosomal acid phosphatase-like protein 3 [Leptotrombidium deliense]|uniref:Lysosomal acid phosphatase-like protein 3 n=1 Tax=Leptotrombidium deliense TaxID=299467 RepID=A0A443RSE6_9ACAR|nr:lysosomal acid phosphatase-like protein 3 [Leptotrombidium deliense]